MSRSDLELLAYERQKLSRLKATEKTLQEALEQTEEYRKLQEAKANTKIMSDEVDRVEELIRSIAYDRFVSDHNKNPVDGIKIKEFSTITILDENEAKRWATENAPSIVTLNKSKFNSAVKALELPFVEKGIEYKVQIASDLSIYENPEGSTSSTTEE